MLTVALQNREHVHGTAVRRPVLLRTARPGREPVGLASLAQGTGRGAPRLARSARQRGGGGYLIVRGSGAHFSAGMDLSPTNPLILMVAPALLRGDEEVARKVIEAAVDDLHVDPIGPQPLLEEHLHGLVVLDPMAKPGAVAPQQHPLAAQVQLIGDLPREQLQQFLEVKLEPKLGK